MEAKLHIELQSIGREMQRLSNEMEETDYGYENFDTLYKEWEALELKGKGVLERLQTVIKERG